MRSAKIRYAKKAVSGAMVSRIRDVTVAGRCSSANVRQKYPISWHTIARPIRATRDERLGTASETRVNAAKTRSTAALAVVERARRVTVLQLSRNRSVVSK